MARAGARATSPILYVLVWPVLFVSVMVFGRTSLAETMLLYVAGYAVWAALAALVLRKWRLVPLVPALIAIDWIYRVVFIHAFVKTVRQPRVEACIWDSPARLAPATTRHRHTSSTTPNPERMSV